MVVCCALSSLSPLQSTKLLLETSAVYALSPRLSCSLCPGQLCSFLSVPCSQCPRRLFPVLSLDHNVLYWLCLMLPAATTHASLCLLWSVLTLSFVHSVLSVLVLCSLHIQYPYSQSLLLCPAIVSLAQYATHVLCVLLSLYPVFAVLSDHCVPQFTLSVDPLSTIFSVFGVCFWLSVDCVFCCSLPFSLCPLSTTWALFNMSSVHYLLCLLCPMLTMPTVSLCPVFTVSCFHCILCSLCPMFTVSCVHYVLCSVCPMLPVSSVHLASVHHICVRCALCSQCDLSTGSHAG